MKQDQLPTYHLAHVIDDYLMQTSLVIRGDEWLSSTTLHTQLSKALGYDPFNYAHIAPIQKVEGNSRRKLSKRKDPEASVIFYLEKGYLPSTVNEYLLNQANSSFESWREKNASIPYTEYPFTINGIPKSGALFNIDKLNFIGADHIAALTVEELYNELIKWSLAYNTTFHNTITANPNYTKQILGIERQSQQPRKDLRCLSEAPYQFSYFYDKYFESLQIDPEVREKIARISREDQSLIIHNFLSSYDPDDSNELWFEKVKQIGESLGFTSKIKEFRKNPNDYKGSIADVAMVIRVGLTKRNRTPNLHEIMQVMGTQRIKERLLSFINS